MSQDYHHHHHQAPNSAGIFTTFSYGVDVRSQQHNMILAQQQIRRDNYKLRGLIHHPPPPLVAIDESESGTGAVLHHGFESAGMLSEMFNFPSGPPSATQLLDHQISSNYHHHNTRPPPSPAVGVSHDWYSSISRQAGVETYNASDSSAMQLFGMNSPSQPKSPSPAPPATNSTLHMLLPNSTGFHSPSGSGFGRSSQYSWLSNATNSGGATTDNHLNHHHEVRGGQGLSLSLSSTLQHREAAKAEEFSTGDMIYFNEGGGAQYSYKNNNLGNHLEGEVVGSHNGYNQVHVGFGSSLGVGNVLRSSKYAKAAQELLEEFCSVGRGQFKKTTISKLSNSTNPNSNPTGDSGGGNGGSTASVTPLSAADRIEHHRRKVKLLSMLDEVERRYNRYCEQMQMVVNSFDMVMGFGSATPYTALAQKAMSRHFRCLKDSVAAELKQSCELLGEKDAGGTAGVTKGETPRLKLLEQSLRQQRAFNHMGLMDQDAWRPQRGLPERSVNILRAWLFEHFLHPYPSDADKHLLSRQTGLSRNQVSNWFINARVRLWKPMVEDMYQQESKEEAEGPAAAESVPNAYDNAQTPTPSPNSNTTTTTSSAPTTVLVKRSQTHAPDNDLSLLPINNTHQHCFLANQSIINHDPYTSSTATASPDTCHRHSVVGGSGHGTNTTTHTTASTTGDVSLTLGLRHEFNMHDKTPLPVRDFGGC